MFSKWMDNGFITPKTILKEQENSAQQLQRGRNCCSMYLKNSIMLPVYYTELQIQNFLTKVSPLEIALHFCNHACRRGGGIAIFIAIAHSEYHDTFRWLHTALQWQWQQCLLEGTKVIDTINASLGQVQVDRCRRGEGNKPCAQKEFHEVNELGRMYYKPSG